VSFLRAWFPRLSFRLYYGLWCDHADRRVGSGYTLAEADSNMHTEFGWGPWKIFDMGRNKIRTCHRCWYSETLTDKPIRRMVVRWWTAYHRSRSVPQIQTGLAVTVTSEPKVDQQDSPPAATMAQVSNVLRLALPEVSWQLGSIPRGERDLIATCLISAFDVRTRTKQEARGWTPPNLTT
jgi:hypothetical protein